MKFLRPIAVAGLLATFCSSLMPAAIPANKNGLPVVTEIALYEKLVDEAPSKALVDLETFIPGIDLDVRYATSDNFMNEILYPLPKVFLRKPAAEALKTAQEEFAERGLGLRVFDGYRPYRVTERMWDRFEDPDYVADPRHGSRHNRGCAVDVTLISLATGKPLAMPTDYDEFTEKAHMGFRDLPKDVLANRELLREVMARHGFDVLPTEWWHFDFRGWENFELMDLGLEELAELVPANSAD